jgi:hypothetical protein
MADAGGSAFEEVRQFLQRLTRIDASRGIVRRIDDDQARPWANRPVNRAEIQVEGRRLQGDLARHGGRRQQQRFIAEPGRLGKDRFVAGVKDVVPGHHDGGERTSRQRDIGRLERQAQFAANMLRKERLRLLFAGLVREPVLIVRLSAFANSRDQARQWPFMGIAEGEVGNSGVQPPLRIAGRRIEPLDGGEGRIRGPYPG